MENISPELTFVDVRVAKSSADQSNLSFIQKKNLTRKMKAISILVIAGTAQAAVGNRKLSFELIAGFEPATLVTSHVSEDLEQVSV